MKRILSFLLIAALLWALAAQGESGIDTSRFSVPIIPTPSIPPIEVPEVPEIEVPKIPTAAPTDDSRIKVPEIPAVEGPEVSAPRATPEAAEQVAAALEALGVADYRALYDALSRGETLGDGSWGDAARGMQQLLAAFGQAVRADGIIGPKTIAALNAVQDQCGLPRTDGLDAAGLAALLPLLLSPEGENPQ